MQLIDTYLASPPCFAMPNLPISAAPGNPNNANPIRMTMSAIPLAALRGLCASILAFNIEEVAGTEEDPPILRSPSLSNALEAAETDLDMANRSMIGVLHPPSRSMLSKPFLALRSSAVPLGARVRLRFELPLNAACA